MGLGPGDPDVTLTLAWTLALIGLVAGASIAILWFVSARMIKRTRWGDLTKASVRDLFHGPGVALIAGYAIILGEAAIWSVYSASLPPFLAPPDFSVLVSLAILWTFISTAATAVRRHVISQQRPGGRDLIYGIYTVGLLALVIILLESPIVPAVAASTWTIIGFLVGILATYIVAHIVNIIMDRYLQGLANRQPRLKTVYSFIRRLILVGIILIGVAVSTYASFPSTAGTVTGLILAAGFLSIVLGLAAQSTLSNLVGGMMVSLTQPFQIGDAVVFGGEWCIVEDIRLTYSVLRTWDLRRLMVPNSMFQSNILVNYTAVDPTMLVIVYMVVTFESNVDRAREIMVEEARKHPDFRTLGNLPITHVMDYQGGGSYGGVNLRLLSAAKDQSTAFQVEKDLLYAIRARFEKEGIKIAYPTQRIVLEPNVTDRVEAQGRGGSSGPRDRTDTRLI
ncbi:MAG: mechanosensitive ion channel family protein [Thermoplasmata archaeon]